MLVACKILIVQHDMVHDCIVVLVPNSYYNLMLTICLIEGNRLLMIACRLPGSSYRSLSSFNLEEGCTVNVWYENMLLFFKLILAHLFVYP